MTEPQVLTTVPAFRAALAELLAARRDAGVVVPTVGLVPTMGALHSGHGALADGAREDSDIVVASIFVNPLQFDDAEDYRHYPRDLDADVGILASHGVDLVFAPALEEMYPGHPDGPLVRVSAGELGRRWEGASRPGHFDGVVTVVTKLFHIMAPPLAAGVGASFEAWFGEKDAEQLAIIRRMVTDLDHEVTIRSVPIVRDDDGLALSSRNQRLGPQDREHALQLSAALTTLARRTAEGEVLDLDGVVAGLHAAQGVDLDYLVVVEPSTLRPVVLREDGVLAGEALALIAARVGPVRLIDTMTLRAPARGM